VIVRAHAGLRLSTSIAPASATKRPFEIRATFNPVTILVRLAVDIGDVLRRYTGLSVDYEWGPARNDYFSLIHSVWAGL